MIKKIVLGGVFISLMLTPGFAENIDTSGVDTRITPYNNLKAGSLIPAIGARKALLENFGRVMLNN